MLYETEYLKTELRKKIDETNELCSLNEKYEAPAYSRGYDFGRATAFRDMLSFIEKIENDELENMFKEYMKDQNIAKDTDFFD